MSASREKKARQERGADYLSPKQQKELEEQKATRRRTIVFVLCVVLIVAVFAAALLNNSGVFKRGAAAATVNGETYTAEEVAYYYYSTRANLINNGYVSSSSSLRDQAYTSDDSSDDNSDDNPDNSSDDKYATWYDYVADQAIRTLASVRATAQTAKDSGFTGGDEMEQTVSATMDSLKSGAASNKYTLADYIKAIFGGLMTKSSFEKELRTAALADSYTSSLTSEAVQAAAEEALAAYQGGESLEKFAKDADLEYVNTTAQYGTSSVQSWLFDDARAEGDAEVLDYTYYGYDMGSMLVVFHGKERADYHSVNVRHILVEDEDTAKDLLAQYEAGEQTEEAFAALATEHSTDTGSSSNGGLYTGVYKGQMVKPFEDWCFAAGRKVGDTGIVQTDYGYHVMYFAGRSSYLYWQELAAKDLSIDLQDPTSYNAAALKAAYEADPDRYSTVDYEAITFLSSDYTPEIASLAEDATVTQLDGMKYIDP